MLADVVIVSPTVANSEDVGMAVTCRVPYRRPMRAVMHGAHRPREFDVKNGSFTRLAALGREAFMFWSVGVWGHTFALLSSGSQTAVTSSTSLTSND
jgi:hypothetical protein